MVETLTEPVKYPPRWYLGFVAVMSGVAVIALVVGLAGLYINDQNAAKQAECFESFADKLATSSQEVREAATRVDKVEAKADNAAATRDAAFQDVLTFIIAGDDDDTEGLRLFTRLTEANAVLVDQRAALVAAREALQRARIEHPIPEAPDTDGKCELLDGTEGLAVLLGSR